MLVVGRQKQRQKKKKVKFGGGGNKLRPSHGEQLSGGILNSEKKNGCIKKKKSLRTLRCSTASYHLAAK